MKCANYRWHKVPVFQQSRSKMVSLQDQAQVVAWFIEFEWEKKVPRAMDGKRKSNSMAIYIIRHNTFGLLLVEIHRNIVHQSSMGDTEERKILIVQESLRLLILQCFMERG
ncbi:hypothetical protein TNCV_4447531 [Trichonephila clavipes]|nr:hypothetical protein TNCV_4447531 [Trichonephila clavipes]